MIREINSISFGIYSVPEIKRLSVCTITSTKKNPEAGTVYDPRMGAHGNSGLCETCNQDAINCPGHFGHIELDEPIPHPLYCKRIAMFLNCICFKCYRLMVSKDQLELDGIKCDSTNTRRFTKIVDKVKKMDFCCRVDDMDLGTLCSVTKDRIKYSPNDNIFLSINERGKDKQTTRISTDEIITVLSNLPDDDVRIMGFNPEYMHPKNLIILLLPVLPPIVRPYVKTDNKICDDDLTNQYIEIVKCNNLLQTKYTRNSSNDIQRQRVISSIRFRILTTFNNGLGRAKQTTNGRPIKGIKERLTGKDGQIRNNMMGKRCDQTARTVIGPGPNLRLGELGFPRAMANVLTIPVRVTSFNIKNIQKLIDDGKIKTIIKPDKTTVIDLKRFRRGTRLICGDKIHRAGEIIVVTEPSKQIIMECDQIERNSKMLTFVKPPNREYIINIGWVVNRHLTDGDFVLLNRQPTLHKASMMAMRVKLTDTKNLQMNLSITKPFNADFDGDEMNIHVPQSLEAQVELKYLSYAQWNIISPQNGKPNMAIVQDSLLGSYKMTNGNVKIEKHHFMNIVILYDNPPWNVTNKKCIYSNTYITTNPEPIDVGYIQCRMNEIRYTLKQLGRKSQCYNGHGLISMFLPPNFNYEKRNDRSDEAPVVRIKDGVFYEGVLDKSIIGSAYNSIYQVLNKEYNATVAAYFIDCIQYATNSFLLCQGFSVGLGDCLMQDPSKKQEVEDIIHRCYVEAEGIEKITRHPNIREIRINASLNKAKDIGLRIARDALGDKNNFISTVRSGSKGDFFNIAQITGLLGQQNLKGKRVQCTLNNGSRTLPHYPYDITDRRDTYESRGFIDNGFLHGLNPRQFYFHAMSGREGICDTAMGTATSGYMQRRIVKLTEDIKIQHDGTVRDDTGRIYQFVYGDTGYDPSKLVKVQGESNICDISRIITRLNRETEMKNVLY